MEAAYAVATDAFLRDPPRTEYQKQWARYLAKATHNARLIRGTLPTAAAPSFDPNKLPAERATVGLLGGDE